MISRQAARGALLYIILAAGVAGVHAMHSGRSLMWEGAWLITAPTMGALGGALGGMVIGRRTNLWLVRVTRRQAVARGTLWGFWLVSAYAALHIAPARVPPGLAYLPVWLFGGVILGGGRVRSDAEFAFSRAITLLKAGNRDGARSALTGYLRQSAKDPLGAARVPAAQAFLNGERDSLDVSVELEAASAPAGRGTELTAAGSSEAGEIAAPSAAPCLSPSEQKGQTQR